MSVIRAILRLFSDLAPAASATADDLMVIQKSGERSLRRIAPTALPFLASSHGAKDITGLGATNPSALGAAAPGNATTVSRSNHVHPMPSASDVGAAASSHSHAIGDLPTPTTGTPAALGVASRGSATTLSRSDHVHPMPSASDVGAAASSHAHGNVSSSGAIGTTSGLPVITTTSGALNTGSWGSTTSNLSSSASGGSSTNFARADHVHAYPTAANVGALPIGGGTLTGSLSLSTGSGEERTVNIGTGRTADGNSFLRFFATNGGAEDAAIFRIGGENSQLVIRQSRGTGGVRFRASVVYVRNAADSAYAPIGASAFNINSDPRAKQAIRRVGSVPTPRALGDAVIEFEWARGGDGRQHVGFNAATIREIAPLASVDMLADPETGESELGVDLAAVIAILARLVADQADRLDALESRG